MPDKKYIYKQSIILLSFFVSLSCYRDLDDSVSAGESVSLSVTDFKILSAKDGMISLSWQLLDEVGIKYYVYYSAKNNKNSFQKIGVTNQNKFTISGLDYDTTYYFAITVFADSFENAFSEILSAKPINVDPPTTPSSLFLYGLNNRGNRSIFLSWNKNTDGDFLKHCVYRIENNENSQYKKIAEIELNSFTDSTNIEVNKYYFYKILAIDKAGFISPFSDSQKEFVLDTTELISPIQNEVVYDTIVFKWKRLESVVGYRLILCSSATNTGFWMKDIPDSGAENYEFIYNGDPLTCGKKYYWKVCAFHKNWSDINSFSDTKAFYLICTGDE
jgi:hypothetical protein